MNSPTMWMIIFTLLPLTGLAYVAWHLWLLLPLSAMCKSVVILLCVIAFALMFVNFTGKLDTLPMWLSRTMYVIGTSSIIVLLYLVLTFCVLDIGSLLHIVPKDFLYNSWAGTVTVFLFIVGIMTYGNLNYLHKVRVPLELTSDKQLQHTYKIVMMSDLHLGYHNGRAELSKWIEKVNAENPDMVLIAGDIIDMSVRPLVDENMAQEFHRIKAPIFACLGNHEYYSKVPQAQAFYRASGITLLSDTAINVNEDICIVGRDDQTNTHRKPVERLLSNVDKGRYIIVLDHQPYHLEKTARSGADFQLSGHTHRGQVWPISWITDAMYECSWGSHQKGKTEYYVSSGIGIWGGKFRIGTQSEYVVATLKGNK